MLIHERYQKVKDTAFMIGLVAGIIISSGFWLLLVIMRQLI